MTSTTETPGRLHDRNHPKAPQARRLPPSVADAISPGESGPAWIDPVRTARKSARCHRCPQLAKTLKIGLQRRDVVRRGGDLEV